jgi:hypothetical protein
LALQVNGKIVTVGSSGLMGFAVARHNVTGTLDGGFLGDGRGTIAFAGYRASDVAIQSDDSILVVGGDKDGGSGSDAEFGLVRLQGGDDTAPPETTITAGPSGRISIPSPTFSFVSSEASSSFGCRVDGAGFTPCSSPRTIAAVSSGAHVFQVHAIDSSGNADPTPATRSFSVVTPSLPAATPKQPTAACLAAKRKRTRLMRKVRTLKWKAKRAEKARGKRRYRRRLDTAKRELGQIKRVVPKRCQ